MLFLFFVLGAAAVVLFLFVHHYLRWWLFLNNRNADFSVPDFIPRGNFLRFKEGIEELFPEAPARSYISISAYNPSPFESEDTKFFIRSAGKRDGKHSFVGELRLSEKDRDHLINALPMLERIGAPLERTDKNYGLVVLKTSKLESVSELVEVASEFSKRVLKCDENDPLTINWHIAGSNGAGPL